jgi:hypothetical protein
LARDRGGERGVPGDDRAHGLDDLVGGGVLEQEAAASGAQGVDDVFVEPEGGEDEDALARQPPGGLDAVHDRHADVHQHGVGRVLRGGLDRLLAGARLGGRTAGFGD